MAVLRRRLLLGGGGGRIVDDFATLSSRWVVQNDGTLAVSGGALQAATLGNWLGNLISNGESWTGGPPPDGWTATNVDALRVDATTDPGAASGGVDNWAVKVTVTSTTNPRLQWTNSPTFLAGGYYIGRCYAYVPSANSRVNAARLTIGNLGAQNANIDAEDAWRQIVLSGISAGGAQVVQLRPVDAAAASTMGDIDYYDSVQVYRRNTPALLAGWRSPNHVATLSHISPAVAGNATDYVPFGYICRYTDSLNYWEVRVLPNTAGNDLQIVQVTAGAETVRAEADIDWTSDDTDELEVTCSGSTISTAHRKTGAGVWTAGPSYASATQGQTSPDVGLMLYEDSVGRVSSFEIRAT